MDRYGQVPGGGTGGQGAERQGPGVAAGSGKSTGAGEEQQQQQQQQQQHKQQPARPGPARRGAWMVAGGGMKGWMDGWMVPGTDEWMVRMAPKGRRLQVRKKLAIDGWWWMCRVAAG
ncbi:hypothetical protein CDD80_2049 [Ophiocordyceps camponoti-rufipedis]|uniref:Uncharacterized protein n=1 Tax=Ophiocordyceps camponoti-rufipedis TaxID=2004952 RepID=A0A2C5Z7P4_9HYPO|nr:hypothetical protein CDD80_2049 [Ophiocordyceps camponoti-rufipedis]